MFQHRLLHALQSYRPFLTNKIFHFNDSLPNQEFYNPLMDHLDPKMHSSNQTWHLFHLSRSLNTAFDSQFAPPYFCTNRSYTMDITNPPHTFLQIFDMCCIPISKASSLAHYNKYQFHSQHDYSKTHQQLYHGNYLHSRHLTCIRC